MVTASLTAILGGSRGGDSPAAQLRIWEQILGGWGSAKHFLLVVMYANVFWAFPPLFACSAGRTALSFGDVPVLLKGICGLAIMISSGSTAFLLFRRRLPLLALVSEARRLSEAAEFAADAQAMAPAAAAAMRRVRVLGFVYIKCGCMMATVEQFADVPAIPRCVQPQPDQPWARLAVASMESAKWSYLATCFFSFWLVVLTLLLAVEAQYSLLCLRVERARGARELLCCCRHLREILVLENAMRDYYYYALLHVLSGALLVPLVNTYQILTGELSAFIMLTLSTLPLVYGTMSMLGDRLALGAMQVGLSAYSSDWLSEPPATRRLRHMLMQSTARAAPFAMSGLGSFLRESLYRVLKTWYQYLNLLIGCMT